MAKLKVQSNDVVLMFEELGAKQAAKWSTSRMMAKVMKLKDYIDEQDAKKLKGKIKLTAELLLAALDDGTDIIIIESDPAAPPETEEAPVKAAKGKKAAKQEEAEEEEPEADAEDSEVEEEPSDEPEEEEKPAKKGKKTTKGKPTSQKTIAKAEKKEAKAAKKAKGKQAPKSEDDDEEKPEKPAKKGKGKAEPKFDMAERKRLKLKVFKDWKKSKDKSLSNKNLDKYVQMCDNEVKKSTVNYWLWAWNKGQGFPSKA